MEDFSSQTVIPGQSFFLDGSQIPTPEGVMNGSVTVRTSHKRMDFWVVEIVGVERPEWEWTLGKNFHMRESQVQELLQAQR